jgi:hypothetical protein
MKKELFLNYEKEYFFYLLDKERRRHHWVRDSKTGIFDTAEFGLV